MNYACSPGDMRCRIDVMIFVTGNTVSYSFETAGTKLYRIID